LRVMQAPPPPLMPLLRSRLQAELLTVVLLTPGREWSLTELAERAGASVSSAQREMARAEDAGRDLLASVRQYAACERG
jgi:DNA-directed RNA polymerase specialized sigma24 family protein